MENKFQSQFTGEELDRAVAKALGEEAAKVTLEWYRYVDPGAPMLRCSKTVPATESWINAINSMGVVTLQESGIYRSVIIRCILPNYESFAIDFAEYPTAEFTKVHSATLNGEKVTAAMLASKPKVGDHLEIMLKCEVE